MAELKICSLRSSSKGNATIVYDEKTKILVDCGISCKTFLEALECSGFLAEEIDAIVITHEHSDHIKGAGVVARKLGIPVFATRGTWRAMEKTVGEIPSGCKQVFEEGQPFRVGDITVLSFPIPHDAENPVGFTFVADECKASVVTDIGIMTNEIFENIKGSKRVLLESNYDLFMLEAGTYPYELKCRIKSQTGHLSNEDAALAVKELVQTGTKEIILGHISPENNYPDLAFETTKLCLFGHGIKVGEDARVYVAKRDQVVMPEKEIVNK